MNNTKLLIIGAAGIAAAVYLIGRARQSTTPTIASAQAGASSSGPGAGGTLATLGAWFGMAAQLVDPSAARADRSTPVYNPAVVSNPVIPSPAVLAYSYKQATIDVPALLGTDQLFTPSVGSSGAYSEDDGWGTAAGPTSTSYWG
jgi:hypothetical protein